MVKQNNIIIVSINNVDDVNRFYTLKNIILTNVEVSRTQFSDVLAVCKHRASKGCQTIVYINDRGDNKKGLGLEYGYDIDFNSSCLNMSHDYVYIKELLNYDNLFLQAIHNIKKEIGL